MNVARNLLAALRDHYPPPDWFMAYEVQVERLDGSLSFADAVAVRLRKGFVETHCFELKVSRADWLNEVRDPGKGVAVRALCDYAWVVAGNPGIVRDEEVPEGVGLLEAHGGIEPGFLRRFQARRRDAAGPVQPPIDRALLAAVLRRLDPLEPRRYWEARIRIAERKGYAKGRSEAGRFERKAVRLGMDVGAGLDLP